jgi:hypothetical protein
MPANRTSGVKRYELQDVQCRCDLQERLPQFFWGSRGREVQISRAQRSSVVPRAPSPTRPVTAFQVRKVSPSFTERMKPKLRNYC